MTIESMEDNLIYRLDELADKVNTLTSKIDKINDIIVQFKIADTSIGLKLENLEKQVKDMQEEQDIQNKAIQALKDAPLKKDSQNWRTITSTVFKYVLDIALIGILIKIGLK